MGVSKTVLVPKGPAIDLVHIISEGTYTSFAQAIKEFISNSWDADARNVNITVDQDDELIRIHDDGVGMTIEDFKNSYASIARRGKAAASTLNGRTAKMKRKKVGRFGIGALAVAGIAAKFAVRSSKAGRKDGFEASIDLTKVRQQFRKDEDLKSHWKFTVNKWDAENAKSHFTEVIIEGVDADIWNKLLMPGEKSIDEGFQSISQLSGLDQLAWRLGIICPVAYAATYPVHEDQLARPADNVTYRIGGSLKKARFNVRIDGTPVKRRIALPDYNGDAKMLKKLADPDIGKLYTQRGLGFRLRNLHGDVSGVGYDGYLVTQATQIYPEELRGILIRIRGVAVGWHRTVPLATRGASPALPAMSGELWVDGLDKALQFDRESFREDHPKYISLMKALTGIVNEEGNKWRARSKDRRAQEKSIAEARKATTSGKKSSKKATKKKTDTKSADDRTTATGGKTTTDQFLPSTIFDNLRPYVLRTVTQINGCWNYGYYEACAVMIRRLIQLLIMDLYASHGVEKELKNGTEYLGLKKMLDKAKHDPRFGFDKRVRDGLDGLKKLGDIAAHDFRVVVRKAYLSGKQDSFRYTCERLVHYIENKTVT